MKDIWVLFRKEVAGLSRGLTFWLAAGGMLLLSGWLLILNLWAFSQQAIIFGGPGMDFNEGMVTPMLGEASFFALLIAPFLTIGLFAQEKR
ncbi:hypothetical protein H8D30_06955 [bacterium]|nr:hypothetical protein [bacterium]